MTVRFIDISDAAENPLTEERAEHRALVLEDLLKNPSRFIEEYHIELTKAKNGAVRVALPMRPEYRFILVDPSPENRDGYSESKFGKSSSGVGQNKSVKKGQKVGEVPLTQEGQDAESIGGPHNPADEGKPQFSFSDDKDQSSPRAGQEPGEVKFEENISIEKLHEALTQEFSLPNLDKINLGMIKRKRSSYPSGYRRRGPAGQLSDYQTAKKRLERLASEGPGQEQEQQQVGENFDRAPKNIINEDLRYRRRAEREEYISDAVIFLDRDTSGSIDEYIRNLCRALSMHLYRAIQNAHEETVPVFITHDVEARQNSEWEFFHRASSGGTYISSGIDKILEAIQEKYSPELWNIFAFIFSDGDNADEDRKRLTAKAKKLCEQANLVVYFEVSRGAIESYHFFLSNDSPDRKNLSVSSTGIQYRDRKTGIKYQLSATMQDLLGIQRQNDNLVLARFNSAKAAAEVFNRLLDFAEQRRQASD